MPRRLAASGLSSATAVLLVASAAQAQLGTGDRFSSSLDSSVGLTIQADDERAGSSVDRSTVFGNYGGRAVAAPGGSSTNGIISRVNLFDEAPGDQPEGVAVNFYPSPVLGTNDNWSLTVNAYADLASSSNPSANTEVLIVGLGASGDRTNWRDSTNTDGIFWEITTNGGASNDLLSLEGTPGSPASLFQVRDIDGNAADVDFAPGTFSNTWLQLSVGVFDNQAYVAVSDGSGYTVLESFDTFSTAGRAFFGHADPFSSANADVAALFDNASIQNLEAGDTDFDGDVDFNDFIRLRRSFSGTNVAADTGQSVPGGFDADLYLWTAGDFDADRDVDFTDAVALIGNFTGREAHTGDAATAPVELVVQADGSLSLVGDLVDLQGVEVASDSGMLEGSGALELTLTHTAAAYAAVTSQTTELRGAMALNLRHSGNIDDLSFSYGTGGAVLVGAVRAVPEPGSAVALLALVGLSRRRRG